MPVSLIGTFRRLSVASFGINTLSLFARCLIGLVVDDAIVVVEAVEHHIEDGMSPREATLQAMEEVSGPVISIALILASVFIPVAFVSGIQGRLNKQFAVTIAVSVLISAFNALTLSPALSALLLRPRKETRGPLGQFFGVFNRWFAKATHGYVGLSRALIRKAIVGVLIVVGFALLDGVFAKKLPTSFLPEEDYGFLFLNIQLPPAASLERTDQVSRKVEKILSETDGIEGYNTINGFSLLNRVSASYNGFFFVALKPWSERKPTAEEILKKVNGRLPVKCLRRSLLLFHRRRFRLGNLEGSHSGCRISGGTVEFRSESDKALMAAQKRPEAGGSLVTILRRRAANLC